MNTTAVIATIGFFTLAVINFAVYTKLSKYLYISAGVTKEDAQRYANEQGANATQRLGQWLKRNAKHPEEFNKMFTVCNISSILFMTSFAFAAMSLFAKGGSLITIGAVALPVLTLGISVFGFSYGKNIEARFENFYSSADYKPYEGENIPDEIESMDELYIDNASELKNQNTKTPIQRFFPLIAILVFVGIGVLMMLLQNK